MGNSKTFDNTASIEKKPEKIVLIRGYREGDGGFYIGNDRVQNQEGKPFWAAISIPESKLEQFKRACNNSRTYNCEIDIAHYATRIVAQGDGITPTGDEYKRLHEAYGESNIIIDIYPEKPDDGMSVHPHNPNF